MDHDRYGQPEFNMAGAPRIRFLSNTPSPVPEVPFYMHQVLNPNTPPPPPPPPPPQPAPPHGGKVRWDDLYGGGGGIGSGINLNHGTSSGAVSTTIRWPRQETLTLLEIRSRLDPYFKEATSSNPKGPLWDEVSRIMKEEYGYQRSGRKCKEKFENLFKYYKKTKEGKIGKHDGKHYRFFRQLEALYGDQSGNQLALNSNSNSHRSTSSKDVYPSSLSSEFETSSPEKKIASDHEFDNKGWMASVEEFIESHVEKLMDKQDDWGEKILSVIEEKEQERIRREEEWRKREAARFDQQYEAWANHIARIEARDRSLLEGLQNISRVRSLGSSSSQVSDYSRLWKESTIRNRENNEAASATLMQNLERREITTEKCSDWVEPEISSLIHIRTSTETKFQESGDSGESLWEEVAFRLSLLGYNRTGFECKETWEKICMHFNKTAAERDNGGEEDSRTRDSLEHDLNSATKSEILLESCFNSAMNIEGDRSWENT